MLKSFHADIFDPSSSPGAPAWTLVETAQLTEDVKKAVDGKSILGVVRGPFFVPDGKSANGRFYPRSLWEKTLALPEIQNRMRERMMFGCIGHDNRAVTEKDLEEGRVSHVISRLWISPEGHGMGEALILGTPAGQHLYTFLKAGCRLKTSTRADGKLSETETMDGVPVVDSDSYVLETVDFVLRPGFEQTDAKIISENRKRGKLMSEDTLTRSLLESRDELQKQNMTLLNESQSLRERNVKLERKLRVLSAEVERQPAIPENFGELLEEHGIQSVEQLAEVLASLPSGTLNSLCESGLDGVALQEYIDIGEPQEITEALQSANRAIKRYLKLGTPEQIEATVRAANQALREYLAIGSVVEIRRALRESNQALRGYLKVGGTISEVSRMRARSTALAEARRAERVDAIVEDLVSRYRVDIDTARRLVETHGSKEARQLIQRMSEVRRAVSAPKKRKELGLMSENRCERFFRMAGGLNEVKN